MKNSQEVQADKKDSLEDKTYKNDLAEDKADKNDLAEDKADMKDSQEDKALKKDSQENKAEMKDSQEDSNPKVKKKIKSQNQNNDLNPKVKILIQIQKKIELYAKITPSLDKFSNNPRIAGYRNYLPLIEKLKKFSVWSIIVQTSSRKILKKISIIFKINYRTIKGWSLLLKIDKDWLPNHKKKGVFTRVFRPHEFESLVYFINQICLSKKVIVTNKLVHDLTIAFYNAIPNPRNPKLNFNASERFIIRLKEILDFSSRRFHLKRRPSHSLLLIFFYLARLYSIYRDPQKEERVLNCDETFWRIADFRLSTWAKKGSDNIVIENRNDEKEGFSALATVSSTGKKFPLVLIAAGKTQRVESNWFGSGRNIVSPPKNPELLPNPYLNRTKSNRSQISLFNATFRTDHSEKGWTNNETFQRYLKNIRTKWFPPKGNLYSRENRIYLLNDTYPAHISVQSMNKCLDLNIDPITIPEGCTDLMQPLDHRLFGVMKAKERAYLEQRISSFLLQKFDHKNCSFTSEIDIPEPISKKTAAALLEIIYNEVPNIDIIDAFNQTFKKYLTLYEGQTYSEDDDFELRLGIRYQKKKKKSKNFFFQIYRRELVKYERIVLISKTSEVYKLTYFCQI